MLHRQRLSAWGRDLPRLFDTAELYQNEHILGAAIASSGIDRREFVIMTKLDDGAIPISSSGRISRPAVTRHVKVRKQAIWCPLTWLHLENIVS